MTQHGTILLVGDGADVSLAKRALAEADVRNPVHVVHTGEEAVKYLSGQDKFADRSTYPLPALLLLDLTLPDGGGFAVLRWLIERPGLRKKFTVVAMGTADPDSEIQLAYELGAQSYLVKPTEYAQWATTLRRVKEYWLELNRLLDSAA